MAKVRITCIQKPDRFSPHEHITAVGDSNGNVWPRESVIRWIESKEHSFFVEDPGTGRVAFVGVFRERGKDPYLRTHADGKWNDNLLALPKCR